MAICAALERDLTGWKVGCLALTRAEALALDRNKSFRRVFSCEADDVEFQGEVDGVGRLLTVVQAGRPSYRQFSSYQEALIIG